MYSYERPLFKPIYSNDLFRHCSCTVITVTNLIEKNLLKISTAISEQKIKYPFKNSGKTSFLTSNATCTVTHLLADKLFYISKDFKLFSNFLHNFLFPYYPFVLFCFAMSSFFNLKLSIYLNKNNAIFVFFSFLL